MKINDNDTIEVKNGFISKPITLKQFQEMTGMGKPAIVKALMTLIKPNLDANSKKYANGAKGCRPSKATQKPNDNQKVNQ